MTEESISAQIVFSENIDRVNNQNGLGSTVRLVNPWIEVNI